VLHLLAKQKNKPSRKAVTGKTLNQAQLIACINKYPTTVVTGPAGSGKTFITASRAAEMLLEGKVTKIVVTRPTVPTGRSLGYFPGSLEEKMAPWTIPIMEVLQSVLGGAFECQLKLGNIEVVPFETIRGRSFKDTFVILDEGQNATYDELKALLTRSGENCTTVINGDISQSDLRGTNGLYEVSRIIAKQPCLAEMCATVQFTKDDIVRSKICRLFVEAFEDYEKELDELQNIFDNQESLPAFLVDAQLNTGVKIK